VRNAGLAFVSRPVATRVERTTTPFTSGFEPGAMLRLPVAHGDGRYVADAETLARLEGEGEVVLRYVPPPGGSEPDTPNGSMHDIAGVSNPAGNVIGIMPHPERLADPALGAPEGLTFFTSLAAAAAGAER
ncbi:MAG: phosphoribosylformylglycinamidine synthase subunit PurQ, partial [Gemmatimonadota bacterium]